MKNAAIFHGTSGTPEHFWHPYLKQALEDRAYSVWVPQLPEADTPNITSWLPFALKGMSYTSETVLVGHSAGAPLILSILENLEHPIHLAILVAAFYKPLGNDSIDPIVQPSYDWEKIRYNSGHSIIINSDNDPWGCNAEMGSELFQKIGGDLIIRHGEGHMGSETYHQPYKTFPLLARLVDSFT